MPDVAEILKSIGHQKLDELKHYASPYYDPAKAKAYYERTKQLKGTQPKLEANQRSDIKYVKENISNAKKAETQQNSDAQKAHLEAIRTKADQARQAVQDKLDSMSKDFDAKVAAIESPVADVPVNKIPTDAPDKVKAFLTQQNQHIRDANAVKKRKQDQAQIKALADIVKAAKQDAADHRKAIADELKTSLQSARDGYKAQVTATTAKYKTAVETEVNNITTKVAGIPAPKKKSTTKKH